MDTIFLISLLLCVCTTHVRGDYVAAVVEHAPLEDETPTKTIERNLNEYRNFLSVARRSNVDIIVFPEYGLTGVFEDPTDYAIPIPDVGTQTKNLTSLVLQAVSEAAIEHHMYIVINIAEKAVNEKNKTVYHNTNVVFDRSGKMVAKYRKLNLYDEAPFTPGKVEDLHKAVFETDFGRTFGTFICFDVAFYAPSREILSLNGTDPVTDIAYPTAWYSIVPFYHSLSFHQAYAAENKVNFLVANINNGTEGHGGSGIFGADGTVYRYYLSGRSSSKILISTVPTGAKLQTLYFPDSPLEPTEELAGFNTPHYFKAADYKFKLIDLSKGNISARICDGTFCCNFVLNLTESSANSTTAVYQIMAYRGSVMLGPGVNGPSKMCFLLACETKNPNTCGTRSVNNTAVFRRLTVETTVRNELSHYHMPVTLTTNLLPVFNSSYEAVLDEAGFKHVQLQNLKQQQNVLAFGFFSNGVDRLSISLAVVGFALIKYFL